MNRLPDVGEIRRVYAGNRSTEVINIWCYLVNKLGIYRQKTVMGHPPPQKKIFFLSPLAPKLLVQLKKSKRLQNGTDILYFMQSLVEMPRCRAA